MKTGLYSYLCHPDLFMRTKKNLMNFQNSRAIVYAKAAKDMDIPLEYNLAGAAYNDIMNTTQYPHPEFWKIAAEVGNKTIIGVDAHEPKAMENNKYRDEAISFWKG